MKDQRAEAQQKKRFCSYYLLLGNGEEAAVRAGIAPEKAADYAAETLRTPACRAMLRKARELLPMPVHSLVLTGLTRLAFGKANDAARLVFADEMPPPETLDSLDLFHVSELKRVKGGGVEIKLFDRQKALERLLQCADTADSAAAANALIAALTQPAEEVTAAGGESDYHALFPEAT